MTRLKYPQGPVTPHGVYEILKGNQPMVSLVSPNGQLVFWLMGGQSKADPTQPESVQVQGLKGLIAPWDIISQQSANEDGITFVDALYGPTEVNIDALAIGRDGKNLRRTIRHFLECLDAKTQSELGWITHELGYWWAPVRWLRPFPDPMVGAQQQTQPMKIALLADSAFWQSYPDDDEFVFLYEDFTDTFNEADYTEAQNLGPNWPQLYSGNGVGFHYSNGRHAIWSDDPDSVFFTGTRRVVIGPFDSHETDGDDQEVSIVINNTPQYTIGSGAANDIWGRMGRNLDGTWNGTGVRGRIGWGYVEVAAFVDFEMVWRHRENEFFPPHAGETWTLRCGADGDARRFKLVRDDFTTLNGLDSDGDSAMGADYRGVGFGMQGGASVITQATPGQVRSISADGDLLDSFEVDIADNLGANWPLYFEGRNDAYVRAANGEAEWVDNSGTETQEVVNGPYKDFHTATNNQVVSMVLGSFPEWSSPETGANDLWGRMGRDADGNWDGNGIRLRVERRSAYLTAFVNFEPVWERVRRGDDQNSQNLLWTPFPGDKWTLVCGFTGDERMFKVYRNNGTLLEHKESGTQSLIGEDYRGVGFGVRAGGALITQATPAIVRKIAAGDNAEVTQEGFLRRCNAGDQPAYDAFTFYGPGTVGIANGPGSTDMVTLGPLLPGEIAHINTDPRTGGVYDFTERTGNETKPLLFGANPTDTMYAKMKGRFTNECQIPPKQPGMRAQTYQVKVSITGGNADSKVAASLTPLRRSPQ